MPIQATRTMLRAALAGDLDDAEYRVDDVFGLEVPLHVPGVDDALLEPRSTWRDPEQYDVKARELAELFVENFSRRFAGLGAAVRAAGPRV
jgi:phosphoenolpyruvate carboxykinase (ATP)